MKRKIKMYLSGPILGCDKYTYKAWRDKTKKELANNKYIFLDPTLGEIFDKEAEHADEVVTSAQQSVEEADVIFVYIPFYSMGTSFEVFWAFQKNKKIIIALEAEHESAFVRKFADYLFYSLEDAIDFLKTDILYRDLVNE